MIEKTVLHHSFAADLEELEGLRTFLGPVCGDEMQLAATEAFTNIVKHGYGGFSGKIEVAVEVGESEVMVELADQAPSFDPATASPPDLSGINDHGFGLYIIAKLVDQVSYQEKQGPTGWNRLRLKEALWS